MQEQAIIAIHLGVAVDNKASRQGRVSEITIYHFRPLVFAFSCSYNEICGGNSVRECLRRDDLTLSELWGGSVCRLGFTASDPGRMKISPSKGHWAVFEKPMPGKANFHQLWKQTMKCEQSCFEETLEVPYDREIGELGLNLATPHGRQNHVRVAGVDIMGNVWLASTYQGI